MLFDIAVTDTDAEGKEKIVVPKHSIVATDRDHAVLIAGAALADTLHDLRAPVVVAVPFRDR